MMLELSSAPKEWSPKIIKTIATENQGIDTLVEKVKEHLEFLLRNGILAERRKERTRYEVFKMIEHETLNNLEELITSNKDLFDHRLENIVNRNEDPYLLAKQVLITISKKMSKKCETA
ncbi:MAG: hypothetical protein SWO11_23520 [Thermodesulfobacteriota bacterium]|nr:hypothetical protein [Thermodesulfobacteriota bacterium]